MIMDRIIRSESSHKELPIGVNNPTKCIAMVTRINQNVREEIDCSGITPTMYFVGKKPDWDDASFVYS